MGLPGLKYLGFGLWNAWTYAGLRGFGWGAGEPIGMVDPLFRCVTVALEILITLLALLALRPITHKLVDSVPFVLGCGILASVGTLMLVLLEPGALPTVAYLTLTALPCSASVVLLLKSAQLYGTLRPLDALRRVSESALAMMLVYFVLVSVPAPVAAGLYVSLFFVSATLLCLYNLEEIPQSERLEEYLDVNTVPHANRLFFTVTLVVFTCSASFTLFSRWGEAEGVATAYAYSSFFAALFSAMCIVVFSTGMPRFSFAQLFHPLALLFVLFFAVPMFFNLPREVGMVTAEVYMLLVVLFLPAIWAFLSYRSKASPVGVFALGFLWMSCGNLLGWIVGQSLPLGTPDESWGRIVFGISLMVAFMVALVLVLPRDLVPSIVAPIDDAPDFDDAQAGERNADTNTLADDERFGLTKREAEVLDLILEGCDNGAIAEKLSMSYYTARAHVRNIYTKTNVHSRHELVELFGAKTGRK